MERYDVQSEFASFGEIIELFNGAYVLSIMNEKFIPLTKKVCGIRLQEVKENYTAKGTAQLGFQLRVRGKIYHVSPYYICYVDNKDVKQLISKLTFNGLGALHTLLCSFFKIEVPITVEHNAFQILDKLGISFDMPLDTIEVRIKEVPVEGYGIPDDRVYDRVYSKSDAQREMVKTEIEEKDRDLKNADGIIYDDNTSVGFESQAKSLDDLDGPSLAELKKIEQAQSKPKKKIKKEKVKREEPAFVKPVPNPTSKPLSHYVNLLNQSAEEVLTLADNRGTAESVDSSVKCEVAKQGRKSSSAFEINFYGSLDKYNYSSDILLTALKDFKEMTRKAWGAKYNVAPTNALLKIDSIKEILRSRGIDVE